MHTPKFLREMLAWGSAALASSASIKVPSGEGLTEPLPSVKSARPRGEEEKHTHNDTPGEASHLQHVEAVQAPVTALEEDGYSAVEMMQRSAQSNAGRYKMPPNFDTEEFVPQPEVGPKSSC